MNILGFSIAGLLALVLLVVGLAMVTKWKLFGIGVMLRSAVGKKIAVILGIALIVISVGGAITYVKGFNLGSGNLLGTASLGEDELPSTSAITSLACVFAVPTEHQPLDNLSFRADPSNLAHYYVDAKYDVDGDSSFNGTLSCKREGDIEKAGKAVCYAMADSFRSETSTSDSNTYYIVDTSASASKVTGFPWAQVIYLNDGAIATTSSDREKTDLVFTGGSSAESQEDLGYYITLPGNTIFGYLNNQTSNDINIYCNWGAGDQEVAKFTITKTTA